MAKITKRDSDPVRAPDLMILGTQRRYLASTIGRCEPLAPTMAARVLLEATPIGGPHRLKAAIQRS